MNMKQPTFNQACTIEERLDPTNVEEKLTNKILQNRCNFQKKCSKSAQSHQIRLFFVLQKVYPHREEVVERIDTIQRLAVENDKLMVKLDATKKELDDKRVDEKITKNSDEILKFHQDSTEIVPKY